MRIAATSLGLWLLCIAPALAFRSIDAQCDGNASPVQVPKCFAWMDLNERDGQPSNDLTLRLWLFSPQRADAVRFSLTARDAFGQVVGTYDEDLVGDITTGPSSYDGTGQWRLQLTGFPDNIAHISVKVETVHFKDGTTWHEGTPPSGLYYPPRPSPTP